VKDQKKEFERVKSYLRQCIAKIGFFPPSLPLKRTQLAANGERQVSMRLSNGSISHRSLDRIYLKNNYGVTSMIQLSDPELDRTYRRVLKWRRTEGLR